MKNNKHAQVFHFDVFGKRQDKYDFLDNHSIGDIDWNELQPENPNYFLVSKDFDVNNEYERGIKVDELFCEGKSGVTTERDEVNIAFSKNEIQKLTEDFKTLSIAELRGKFNLKESSTWSISDGINDLKNNKILADILAYRVFDSRFTHYTGKTNGIAGRPRFDLMKHFLRENLGLVVLRQSRNSTVNNVFITNKLIGKDYISSLDRCTAFPLYLYPETNAQQTIGQTTERTPNLNSEIVKQFEEKLGLTFVSEKEPEGKVCYVNNPEVRPDFKTTFAPIDILDYIYAVLHSPIYREKYKEFLKIDFPRVPYPNDVETFWKLVELGSEIRQIHLLESPKVNQFITIYPNDGNNTITRKMTTASPGWEATNEENTIGRVWINDQQFFDGVPLIAWEFYIGGYQPAQKWLKDRHGRTLNFEYIIHYQKIIVALTETHRLMQEVNKVGVE
jgi:predicted helicase